MLSVPGATKKVYKFASKTVFSIQIEVLSEVIVSFWLMIWVLWRSQVTVYFHFHFAPAEG